MTRQSGPNSDDLTPDERGRVLARRRAADEAAAGLFLAIQIERDLAGRGKLTPDDYVEISRDPDGAFRGTVVREELRQQSRTLH